MTNIHENALHKQLQHTASPLSFKPIKDVRRSIFFPFANIATAANKTLASITAPPM